jgi:hypothetical protein
MYLSLYFTKTFPRYNYYAFMLAFIACLSMAVSVIRQLSVKETHMSCVITAASNAAIVSGSKSEAAVNGAIAAAIVSKDAGMNESEIAKAAIVGKLTGEMIAEAENK